MCLIALDWQPQTSNPLLLLANRDEFHQRPTAALHWWDWPDGTLAGRDLEAKGTWLAVNRTGKFAAITNFRQPGAASGSRSRGMLPVEWLESDQPAKAFAEWLQGCRSDYSPFSLLFGQVQERQTSLWLVGTYESPYEVQAGIHVLSNHQLDAPWPKANQVASKLRQLRSPSGALSPDELMDIMRNQQTAPDDQLPDTGVGLDMERFLSSPMIISERYGTRSCTLLNIDQRVTMLERSFDPAGEVTGQRQFGFQRTHSF